MGAAVGTFSRNGLGLFEAVVPVDVYRHEVSSNASVTPSVVWRNRCFLSAPSGASRPGGRCHKEDVHSNGTAMMSIEGCRSVRRVAIFRRRIAARRPLLKGETVTPLVVCNEVDVVDRRRGLCGASDPRCNPRSCPGNTQLRCHPRRRECASRYDPGTSDHAR